MPSIKMKVASVALGIAFSLAVALVTPLRGQFVYVTNTFGGISAYNIGSNGALIPVPGSAFAAASGLGSVAVDPSARFVYVANGFVNPVTLQIGTFSVIIPADSFKQNPNGRLAFEGVINGVRLEVQIVLLGNNIFTFKTEGTGVNSPLTEAQPEIDSRSNQAPGWFQAASIISCKALSTSIRLNDLSRASGGTHLREPIWQTVLGLCSSSRNTGMLYIFKAALMMLSIFGRPATPVSESVFRA